MAVSVCDRCGGAGMDAGGERVPVGPEVVEMAGCDAQHIGRVDTHVGTGDAHVGRADAGTHVGPVRATQTIPPAVRRAVLRRHGGTCAVPGCRNHAFVDVHHTVARAEGGDHDPDKLCVLCACHHRAAHDGRLVVSGTWSTGLRFQHADATPYGRTPGAGNATLFSQVHGALRSMGFKDRQARTLVDAVRDRTHVGTDPASLLHEALRAAPITGLREGLADYHRLRPAA